MNAGLGGMRQPARVSYGLRSQPRIYCPLPAHVLITGALFLWRPRRRSVCLSGIRNVSGKMLRFREDRHRLQKASFAINDSGADSQNEGSPDKSRRGYRAKQISLPQKNAVYPFRIRGRGLLPVRDRKMDTDRQNPLHGRSFREGVFAVLLSVNCSI